MVDSNTAFFIQVQSHSIPMLNDKILTIMLPIPPTPQPMITVSTDRMELLHAKVVRNPLLRLAVAMDRDVDISARLAVRGVVGGHFDVGFVAEVGDGDVDVWVFEEAFNDVGVVARAGEDSKSGHGEEGCEFHSCLGL